MAAELRYYFYGEVFFTTNARRTNAGRRLDNFVSGSSFVAGLWDLLIGWQGNTWVAGRLDITGTADNGTTVPGLRFCYYTLSATDANTAAEDIVKNWARYEDTNSWWAYTAATVTV